jgi:flavin reductase (DIM6/NTAB) family NADH-FMN oxidoreductase RutF
MIGDNLRKELGKVNALYPMPVVIVGTWDEDRENYVTIAHVGIFNSGQPQYISIGLNKAHHTNDCIRKSKAFSVCLPSVDMVESTDYVGLVSGRKTDKSKVYDSFYSEKRNSPMIDGCSVCMDCRLHEVLDYRTHDIFVGEILATYAEESVLTEGHIDIAKLRPMLFDMGSKQYWSLGKPIAKAWDIGKKFKPKK